MKNQFLENLSVPDTFTENGALAYSTTKSAILDYFGSTTSFERTAEQVSVDLYKMWAENPLLTLKTIFYTRMITREVAGMPDVIHKGQGNRNEFRHAMNWLSNKDRGIFERVLRFIPVVGSWKDVFHPELRDTIGPKLCAELITFKLNKKGQENVSELVHKYIPTIRSKSNIKNEKQRATVEFAKKLCRELGMTHDQYRKFKASGKLHNFQRKMCRNQWNELNFDEIPGIALAKLVSSKGKEDGKTIIERHNLEPKYIDWIKSKPCAPFNGYPYQLLNYNNLSKTSLASEITIEKQFNTLIERGRKAGGINGNVFVAVDSSRSMSCPIDGSDTSALDVAVSLGIYFSKLNTGAFKDHIIGFDSQSKLFKLPESPIKAYREIVSNSFMGSTNFLSVIDCIVQTRKKNPAIHLREYPSTILVVSDMQFNDTGNRSTYDLVISEKFAEVGLPVPTMIWWQVNSRGPVFHGQMNDPGTVIISGFDGNIITSILGGEQTKTEQIVDSITQEVTTVTRKLNPYENMLKALDQPVLNLLEKVM